MFWSISEGVKELVKNMVAEPDNWEQQAYHFVCKSSSDIAIWTANGVFALKIEGNDSFTSAEKRYISNGIKKTIALKVKPK